MAAFAVCLLVVWTLAIFHCSSGLPIVSDSIDQGDLLDFETRDSNATTAFERSCRTKTLCPEGIANIVVGAVLFGFLGCFACAMWQWEVQGDRKARIRIALARNREIDRQIEAARISREQQAPPPAPPLQPTVEEEEAKTVGGVTTTASSISKDEDKTALLELDSIDHHSQSPEVTN